MLKIALKRNKSLILSLILSISSINKNNGKIKE
jgi:hypothetical protein